MYCLFSMHGGCHTWGLEEELSAMAGYKYTKLLHCKYCILIDKSFTIASMSNSSVV